MALMLAYHYYHIELDCYQNIILTLMFMNQKSCVFCHVNTISLMNYSKRFSPANIPNIHFLASTQRVPKSEYFVTFCFKEIEFEHIFFHLAKTHLLQVYVDIFCF